MANILGIRGYNKSGSSTNLLLAAYGNDVINVNSGAGYGLNLNGNNVEFEVFLDRVFLQNYNARPITFDGTSWTTTYVPRTPVAKWIKKFKSRVYLGNCAFVGPQAPNDSGSNAITFPSRVFHSDSFVGNTLTWGIEWGTNGKTSADSPFFELAQPIAQDFKVTNIKVGDPLFITNGNAQLISKPYYVASIESPFRLRVTENFPVGASSLHYWVGSNWFDVGTDDNDQINGFSDNTDRLLIFKLMSLWAYNTSQLRQLKDAVGTPAGRSILNSKGYTYYFHFSHPNIAGIYRCDGVNSVKISRGIDPFVRGMTVASADDVVSWSEGDELRWYLGTLTNSNYDISMTNAVATMHTITQAWDVSPIVDTVLSKTVFRTGNQEDTYLGTSDDEVLQMSDGNTFNTAAISSRLETKVYYPSGTEIINEFPRIQIISRNARGVRVKYKLWDKPTGVDDYFIALGEITDDKTELEIPRENRFASGIQLEFDDMDTLENDMFVEKISIFYKPEQTRIQTNA